MAEPEKTTTESDETRGKDAPDAPRTSLNEDIRARIERPYKGDVGRPETNDEIYQGSKQR
jgi:hypothetical protein